MTGVKAFHIHKHTRTHNTHTRYTTVPWPPQAPEEMCLLFCPSSIPSPLNWDSEPQLPSPQLRAILPLLGLTTRSRQIQAFRAPAREQGPWILLLELLPLGALCPQVRQLSPRAPPLTPQTPGGMPSQGILDSAD